jgi:hypothetical protein
VLQRRLTFAAVDQRTLIPVKVAIDSQDVRAETRLAGGGAYALVLSSVLPDHAIELHSTYLGHLGARTRISHLLLAPGVVESEAQERDEDSVPVTVARRRCLYDHLQQLQESLERLGHLNPQIPLDEDALRAIEL